MTKDELFEKFDSAASVKTSIAISCIRKAKTIADARWHATEMSGELQGLYRGYTDVGEMFDVCETRDEDFFKRTFYYKTIIEEELAMFVVNHSKKRK